MHCPRKDTLGRGGHHHPVLPDGRFYAPLTPRGICAEFLSDSQIRKCLRSSFSAAAQCRVRALLSARCHSLLLLSTSQVCGPLALLISPPPTHAVTLPGATASRCVGRIFLVMRNP